MSPTERSQTPVALVKAYDLVFWLLPKTEKLARSYRFTVGDRMVILSLDLLLLMIEAAHSTEKLKLLGRASRRVSGVRHLLRLAKDCLRTRKTAGPWSISFTLHTSRTSGKRD